MTEAQDAPPRVLFFAPSSNGGLAEHVHYQASELVRRGYQVTVLARPDFVKRGAALAYRVAPRLGLVQGVSLFSRMRRAAASIADFYILAWHVIRERPGFVVWEANTEYYAPAWAGPHWFLRTRGIIAVANFHDPVRAKGRRPRWWHNLVLRLAYAPLSGGLIHAPAPPEARLPKRLVMRETPFGLYEDVAAHGATFRLRARLGLPADAFILLAFGHIVDRKNLDHVIEAIREVPEVHLVVAGNTVSPTQRPVEYYRAIARDCGVQDRVHFVTEFIPEDQIAAYFAACDAVCLTYDRAFVSQSGVLQIAALWNRPVLASGGEGPLRRTVEQFGLGVTIDPDSTGAIVRGLKLLMASTTDRTAAFAAYRDTMSWRVNVDRLLEVIAKVRSAQRTT